MKKNLIAICVALATTASAQSMAGESKGILEKASVIATDAISQKGEDQKSKIKANETKQAAKLAAQLQKLNAEGIFLPDGTIDFGGSFSWSASVDYTDKTSFSYDAPSVGIDIFSYINKDFSISSTFGTNDNDALELQNAYVLGTMFNDYGVSFAVGKMNSPFGYGNTELNNGTTTGKMYSATKTGLNVNYNFDECFSVSVMVPFKADEYEFDLGPAGGVKNSESSWQLIDASINMKKFEVTEGVCVNATIGFTNNIKHINALKGEVVAKADDEKKATTQEFIGKIKKNTAYGYIGGIGFDIYNQLTVNAEGFVAYTDTAIGTNPSVKNTIYTVNVNGSYNLNELLGYDAKVFAGFDYSSNMNLIIDSDVDRIFSAGVSGSIYDANIGLQYDYKWNSDSKAKAQDMHMVSLSVNLEF